jgi:hypothetical protein
MMQVPDFTLASETSRASKTAKEEESPYLHEAASRLPNKLIPVFKNGAVFLSLNV